VVATGPADELGEGGACDVEVHYREHAFDFEPSPCESFAGRLVLDDARRELLAGLVGR
jgi:hypothetical protein